MNDKELQNKFNRAENMKEFLIPEVQVLEYLWNSNDGTANLHMHNNVKGSGFDIGKLNREARKIIYFTGFISA